MENQTNPVLKLREDLPTLQAIMGLNRKGDMSVLASQEIAYLEAQAMRMPVIMQCEPISVVLAVKAVLKQNLSLDPYAGLVYIKSRSVNIGTMQAQNWKKVLEIEPTANGKISIARQCGRILDIKRPQVTKNAATGQINGVSVDILLPSYKEPRWETFTFDEDDFYRWCRASHKENARSWKKDSGKAEPDNNTFNYANENYTNFKGGIDPEFARAKAIKHALKKLGTNQSELKPGTLIIENINKESQIINNETAVEEAKESSTNITDAVEVKTDLPEGEEL